jgi:hypothetical protein
MTNPAFYAAARQAFNLLANLEKDPEKIKAWRALAVEAYQLSQTTGAPPPVVFSTHCGYVTAGCNTKIKTFPMPDHRYAEGFLHAQDIFTLGISTRAVFNASDFAPGYARPNNELRNRLNYCAKILDQEQLYEVAALFRAPSIRISESGVITFNPSRNVIPYVPI